LVSDQRRGALGFHKQQGGKIAAIRIFTVAWLSFLVFLSFAPEAVRMQLATTGKLHTVVHLLAFFITAVLAASAKVATLSSVCLSTTIAGILLEALQTVIYHNVFEYSDVLADAAGSIFGCIVGRLLNG
jgi:hypothetical protein